MSLVLFDSDSTYSYVSVRFDLVLDIIFDMLDIPMYVSNMVRGFMVVTQVYRATLYVCVSSDLGRFGDFGYTSFCCHLGYDFVIPYLF